MAELAREWDVELHAGPEQSASGAASQDGLVRVLRRTLRDLRQRLLLDRFETWSAAQFRNWEPKADAALLVGLPASPIVYASARLRARGIPYIVDFGDSWVLKNPDPEVLWPVRLRAERSERRMWEGASGGVFPTPRVAAGMTTVRPGLPVLLRPNGYEPLARHALTLEAPAPPTVADRPRVLRLIHFGTLYAVRVDLAPFFERLTQSGLWDTVALAQYGNDWGGALKRISGDVQVTRHDPIPWDQAVKVAQGYDAALVVGNHTSISIPSKAIQYLTLPIPRVALTQTPADELAAYVADKPGWVTVTVGDPHGAECVLEHVGREWSPTELRPPESESWPAVSREIAGFVTGVLGSNSLDTSSAAHARPE